VEQDEPRFGPAARRLAREVLARAERASLLPSELAELQRSASGLGTA